MIVTGNPGRGIPASYETPQTETIGYALLSFRETKNDTGIAETISEIKAEGTDLEQRLRAEWEVSPEEAVARLEQLKAGLVGVVRFFASRMPPDVR
jgi:hypothetical protein